MHHFNEAKNYAFDEAGEQLAFVAERDSVAKALQKFYKLWYYKPGMDSAQLKANRSSAGITKGLCISQDYKNYFSKDGQKIIFRAGACASSERYHAGLFPETAGLDIWNYSGRLFTTRTTGATKYRVEKEVTLAVINPGSGKIIQLADENCEKMMIADEGNGVYALGRTTKGYRTQLQWGQGQQGKIYTPSIRKRGKGNCSEKNW